MYRYPNKLQKLINDISKLPGIGPKMAERISLYIVRKEPQYIDELINDISSTRDIMLCKRCFAISEGAYCTVCSDEARDKLILCVLESPEDVITMEKTGKFSGYYHILHGLINPLNNIMPDNLKIKELKERLKSGSEAREIILAINHTVEGDATSLYLAGVIKEASPGVRITRLAKGLPTGSDIRYTDEITLGQAIVERKEV